MSTVTLSNPHCAISSAEKPDGIASHAFTTALPKAQICLTLLFAMDRVSFPVCPIPPSSRKAKRRSNPKVLRAVPDCFAAVTVPSSGSLLDARFADANLARGVHYCRPGIIRQGDALLGTLGACLPFGIAGDQHPLNTCDRLGRAD